MNIFNKRFFKIIKYCIVQSMELRLLNHFSETIQVKKGLSKLFKKKNIYTVNNSRGTKHV